MKQKELKKRILEMLESNPKSRDSDQYLTLCIWARYFPNYIRIFTSEDPKLNGKKCVLLEDVMHLPREDGVKRTRAVIQNKEKKFLPTTWEVARKRQIAEGVWREWARNEYK